jgi:hypothetical protein
MVVIAGDERHARGGLTNVERKGTAMQIGEIMKSKEVPVDLIVHQLALVKQLIKEQVHPLDLLRELVSNAAAQEVGATELSVSYTVGGSGHEFEVTDNGCGMDYTGDKDSLGRLDRLLGLGLSGIVGMAADEFSWKGLGSKLAFQSKRIEVETWNGGSKAYRVEINVM